MELVGVTVGVLVAVTEGVIVIDGVIEGVGVGGSGIQLYSIHPS